MKKYTKISIFFYVALFLMAGKCKKKDEETQVLNVKGTWNVVSITNATSVTPSNLANLVGGTFSFTNNNYELKNNAGNVAETGNYTYTASSNLLSVSPSSSSVFTGQANPYSFASELTSNSLSLKLNVAPTGKPENLININLAK